MDIEIGKYSAVQDVSQEFGIPVVAIATLNDLFNYLQTSANTELKKYLDDVAVYRNTYGVIG